MMTSNGFLPFEHEYEVDVLGEIPSGDEIRYLPKRDANHRCWSDSRCQVACRGLVDLALVF